MHVNEKGGSFGGTEEYISLVTSELSRRGVRSHLVCGDLGGTVPVELDSVHVVEGLASREPLAQSGPELVRLIGMLDPDVIYFHNVFDPLVVGAVSAIPNRGPLIWYVHDHYVTCLSELRWRRDHGSCRERLGYGCLVAITGGRCVLRHPDRALDADELGRRRALSRSLGQADEVIVVSEYMRSLLVDAEPHLAERVHLMPRPVRHPEATRTRQRTRADEPAVIAFAGRITPEKGLAVLIEALGSVRSDSRIELCIAGVVEHQAYWSHCQLLEQRASKANAQLRVRYLGRLHYAATDELFNQSDIVAVPSQWPEPFGAVALEAMSAGAAVVASRIGGLDTCLDAGHSRVAGRALRHQRVGYRHRGAAARPDSSRPARSTRPGPSASLHRAVPPRCAGPGHPPRPNPHQSARPFSPRPPNIDPSRSSLMYQPTMLPTAPCRSRRLTEIDTRPEPDPRAYAPYRPGVR